MLDMGLSALSFYLVGWALASGTSAGGVLGTDQFALVGQDLQDAPAWLFGFVFASTSTTIISGAVAERLKFKVYAFASLWATGLIYPLASHWFWHADGWLYKLSVVDLAGCGPVHTIGGIAGLVGTVHVWLGPRLGVFSEDGRYWPTRSSPTNVVFGTFILWAGWFAFNGGSTLGLSGSGAATAGLVTINTALGGGAGVATAMALSYWRSDNAHVDIVDMSLGVLAGLVSITGGPHIFQPWEAVLIGSVGTWIAIYSGDVLIRLKVDDPVGVIPVHVAAAAWGLFAPGFFGAPNSTQGFAGGVLRGGPASQLGVQLLAWLACCVYAAMMMAIFFAAVDAVHGVRVPPEHEMLGLDEVEHNMVMVRVVDEVMLGEDGEMVALRTDSLHASINDARFESFRDVNKGMSGSPASGTPLGSVRSLQRVGSSLVISQRQLDIAPPTSKRAPKIAQYNTKQDETLTNIAGRGDWRQADKPASLVSRSDSVHMRRRSVARNRVESYYMPVNAYKAHKGTSVHMTPTAASRSRSSASIAPGSPGAESGAESGAECGAAAEEAAGEEIEASTTVVQDVSAESNTGLQGSPKTPLGTLFRRKSPPGGADRKAQASALVSGADRKAAASATAPAQAAGLAVGTN